MAAKRGRGTIPRGMAKHLRSLKRDAGHADSGQRPEIVARIEEAYARYDKDRQGGEQRESTE